MIDGLKPYPAYRDSGVPWLGKVPAHWDTRRIRAVANLLVSNVDKHTIGGELAIRLCNYVDVYKNARISDGLAFMRASATSDEIARFRLKIGDVLITKDSELWNDIGVPALVGYEAPDLVCGYHLAILRALENTIIGRYLFRTIQSVGVASQFHVAANGVTRFGLSHQAIKDVRLPVPSLPEQHAIAHFLDYVDGRIRRYIAAKKKLVALLNEQKQAIINRAVTRGLDPNVRLKPSGVEWLGDVPEHWEVKRLKQVITRVEQGWSPQCDAQPATEDEWGVLKVGCVNKDYFDATQNKKLPVTLQPVPALEVENEDILVSRANTRELLGLAALAVEPRRKLMLCDKLFRFRALPQRALPQFLVHAIRGKTSRAQIESSTNGASDSMQNIGQGVIRNLYLALPPLYEQRAIVSVIAQEVRSIQALASQTEREIILIREYRTRLIADVVTGKLDVREAAARLPEEVEEPELEDVGEESPEGEEEEVDQEAALEEVMA